MAFRLSFGSAKDDANLRKHGVSLADAGVVYLSPNKVTFVSLCDSEERRIDIARTSESGIVLVLVYIERGDEIRAISLRRASRQERRRYATAQQD